MIHAKDTDFDAVKDIFKQHKQWFPHVRQDYIKRMIASGNLILENDVIITYNYYKRKQRIGTVTAQQGDCVLHQIAAKNRNGSASQALQNFFNWTNRRVFLSVRNDNQIAKKFYEKNGMDLVGFTSWSKSGVKDALPGDVYMYDNVKEVL
jgi:RimJ/RimL family protein N-acetyltransferase|tara:strand:+ start:104 stop:553 length:450 start_codon:yes stop_codon:yes gene_type:complete